MRKLFDGFEINFFSEQFLSTIYAEINKNPTIFICIFDPKINLFVEIALHRHKEREKQMMEENCEN